MAFYQNSTKPPSYSSSTTRKLLLRAQEDYQDHQERQDHRVKG